LRTSAVPIQGIKWDDTTGQDIHLLRGHSTGDLWSDRLFFIEPARVAPAEQYFRDNQPPDVKLVFQPLFKGDSTPAQNLPPEQPPHKIFSGQGITVDMLTGRVTVAALPPPLPKNNFIMEVTANNKGPGAGPPMTETIRIHLHTSISSLALTPTTLTVRPAAAMRTEPEETGYRFTLRALFDDGTMGDLTEHHGVIWSPDDHVNNLGQLIIAPGDVVNGLPIKITATLPPELGGGTASANLQIAPPWRDDDPALRQISIVPGGGWPGTTLPETAPNILFLGDGFVRSDKDKTAFEQIVTTMVHHLKTDRLVRPFDILCTSMNFWRAFVPSSTHGISFRNEVYIVDQNGTTKVWPVPPPERPPPNGDFRVPHLIYAVGLPVPDDANKSASDLRSDWDALVDNLPGGRIGNQVIEWWKLLATRGFIEELDNFPGMAFGSPPAANTAPKTPTLSLHPFRCGRRGLNSLFALLQSDSKVQLAGGARIGALWAGRPPRRDSTIYAAGDVVTIADRGDLLFVCTTPGTSAAAEPAGYATAADGATVADGTAAFVATRLIFDNNAFVVVVSSFPAGRAVNEGGNIAMSTRGGTFEISVELRTMGFALHIEDEDVPADVEASACRVMAHELAHSFFLGDEYIDFDRDFFGTPGVLNLQSEADTQTNGVLDPQRIRWNWHRIRKAAVIRDAITPVAAGAFKIPVVPGQAWQFRKDDTVLLRRRVPGQPLGNAYDPNATVVSPALQIAVAPSASATNDYLLVQAAPGVNVNLQPFTPGSIVFQPVPAPSSVRTAAYPYAEIVAKNVRDLIGRRHQPLYRQPTGSDLQEELQNERELQQPKLDGLAPQLPGRPFCFKDKERVVGLYEGGARIARGIFHPTGTCMMRYVADTAEFCAVCRYAMVDLINPFHHFQIDLDYDDIYPLT
jgi:hypothetical protein